MTKYYSKKSDFKDGSPDSGQVARNASFVSGGDLPSKVQNILDDIQEAGQVVKDEGLEDKYTQIGDAVLAEDKDSGPFKKSYDRLQTVFEAAKRIHSEVLERIDSKFTRAMDQTFSGLNQVNGEKSPYQSKNLTYQEDRVLHSYNSNYGSQDQHYKVTKHYTLSELLDHEASPIQASKDVYDQRIKQAEALLKANDLKTDGKIKELEGKSAEEVVSSMYPGKIPDYQNLKANSFYEDNKEWLGWVETGLKIGAAVVIIVAGTVGTFGTGTVASVAGGIALVGTGATGAESLYSAATGHTLIAGDQLTTEERWWAAADGAVTILSAGTSAYGKTPALVKNIVSKADDVNDIAQTAHAVISGDNAELAVAQYAGGKALSGLGNLKKQDLEFSKKTSKVDIDSQGRISKAQYDIDLDSVSTRGIKTGHSNSVDFSSAKIKPDMGAEIKSDIEVLAPVASSISKVKGQEIELSKAEQVEVIPDSAKVGRTATLDDISLKKDGTFKDSNLEEKYQKYIARKSKTNQTPKDRLGWKEASDYWSKNSPIARGNNFNKKVENLQIYPHHEVHLSNGKRLDSYDPVAGEIISRKATDLDKIREDTYRGYLSEIKEKYSEGTIIRSDKYPQIDGQPLKGKYILEIPDSNKNLPDIQRFKDIATEYDVTLRFTEE